MMQAVLDAAIVLSAFAGLAYWLGVCMLILLEFWKDGNLLRWWGLALAPTWPVSLPVLWLIVVIWEHARPPGRIE